MPPIAKENEVATARPESAQHPVSTSPGDAAIKQQPVALEVPVTINGARAVDGSDKREPFSETTKTVLVFGNGAVIRLSSSVAPGQLLFLTNEKTKREVVCQVVKSKNYRNVSGYVELEFTESVVGFWGMRFPSDRIASGPQPVAPRVEAPVTSLAPSVVAAKPTVPISVMRVAEPKLTESKSVIPAAPRLEELLPQKPVAPGAPLSSTLSTSFDPEAPLSVRSTAPPAPVAPVVPATPVAATPELSVNFPPANSAAPASVLLDSPRAADAQASFLEPAKSPSAPVTSIPNLLSLFEAKPDAPAVMPPPPAPPSAEPETEALKQHTARLQEHLSSMQFSDAPAEPSTVSVKIPHAPPVAIQKELAKNAAKVLEMSQIHAPEPAPATPIQLVKQDVPAKSSLEDEELKIPAWLEPLARNAAAPSSTQELIEKEKAKRLAEQPEVEETSAESVTAVEEVEEQSIGELPLPTFDSELSIDEEESTQEAGSGSSRKGILIGAIAAGVLLLAGGGWWYMQQQFGGVHAGSAPAANVQASVASLPVASLPPQSQGNSLPETNPPAPSNPAVLTDTAAKSNPAPNTLSVVPASAPAATAHKSQPTLSPASGGAGSRTSALAEPAAEQPKKPIRGAVHLTTPKIMPNRHAQNAAAPDTGVDLSNEEQPDSSAEALNAGLVGGNRQPSAPPPPVGGDVTQAKLISAVPPAYPALAKNQHVSGNVLIDALIDANGRVTTMKVVSGPTLLHQSAMDALKQWKYRPATLDGNPVPMHLTVTIQFRLQ